MTSRCVVTSIRRQDLHTNHVLSRIEHVTSGHLLWERKQLSCCMNGETTKDKHFVSENFQAKPSKFHRIDARFLN